ncbi:MAG: tRNA glutamyl-Q(34) synthetase GluQRS [Pseudomonadota bacterium]
MTPTITERFAPSPTGLLHLGHAFSAILCHDHARAAGGRFLLRLEDLDAERSRPAYAEAIERDLSWLGLTWDGPVLRQSDRLDAYGAAIDRLRARGLAFVCRCSRRDVAEAVSAPQEGAPVNGPDGLVYPGTCRGRGEAMEDGRSIRLDMRAAIAALGGADAVNRLAFTELGRNTPLTQRLDARALIEGTGDIVLRRRDGAVAYHLAVVLDDAHQGVTHVTRGEDLLPAAPLHRLLQALLGLSAPIYRHHRLIRDAEGKRLAKRHDALSLHAMREADETPGSIRARLKL